MAAQTEIEFYLAGAAILTEDGGPVTFLRVIHSGGGRHHPRRPPARPARARRHVRPRRDAVRAAARASRPAPPRTRSATGSRSSVARPLLDRVKRREIELAAGPPSHRPVARADPVADRALRADGEHPRGRPADDRGRRELGDRRSARRRLRDRHRSRHPDARSSPAGLPLSAPVSTRDDHAGVLGHARAARRRRAVRAARARDPPRAGRVRERSADRRDRGRRPVRRPVAVVVRGAALDLARRVARRSRGGGRAAARGGGSTCTRRACARPRWCACCRRSSTR